MNARERRGGFKGDNRGGRAALLVCLALGATAVSGCDGKSAFGFKSKPGPLDSAWSRMEPQRIAAVKGVDYDVNLRWFKGSERSLMVHRVDKQPMFEIDKERDRAMLAATQAYATDVCFGHPLTIHGFTYEKPGVWVVNGQCPNIVGAPVAPIDRGSVLAWLFAGK